MHEIGHETFPHLLRRRAEEMGDDVAVVDDLGDCATYGDLHRRSLAWAGALASTGVVPGDTVLTGLPNSVEALTVWLGAASLGAVEVPVHLEHRGSVLAHLVETATARVAVVDEGFIDTLLPVSRGIEQVIVVGDPSSIEVSSPTFVAAEDVLAHAAPLEAAATSGFHDVACVLFTSGTTGPSKGVVIPWGNLHASALGSLPLEDLGQADVWYGPGSASHVGAKSMPFLFAMLGGKTVLRERLSVHEFWDDIATHGVTCTVMIGPVAHYLLHQEAGPRGGDTTLRNVLMVPLVPELDAFNHRFGTRTCTVFNMTEVSVPVRSDGWETGDWRSCGTVRQGLPGYEVRLVDDHDSEVRDGKIGQMIVRTAEPWSLNLGYLGDPAATVAAWRNGWFHTGDLFRRDKRGKYFFVDRAKDAVRVRGENVSSLEVETEVLSFRGIAECAAIGLPIRAGEELLKVFVVPKDGCSVDPRALVEYLIPRVARFMVPRFVEVVDELPKNWRLRVRKDVLRERGIGDAWDRLAAGVKIPRDSSGGHTS